MCVLGVRDAVCVGVMGVRYKVYVGVVVEEAKLHKNGYKLLFREGAR